ncbi:hypothetical protein SNE25_24250 [Mucilaginibacter sabulilitoris]|uniref:SGNH/GDSL hydrolase family protein n=1 Tax=Mucilaginibacter sabulilitoris TaxID=1173583 RepID=A0ABZ0THF7_9SPHI|nr:hypothetical protein [Mucilaginibacter sabulilitoris]WPU92443.1 hypothetical protein SNE25_24250 [Mucilaginibacter sabulilitoris]
MKRFTVRLCLFIAFASVFYVVTILIFGTFMPASLAKNFDNFGSLGFTRKRMSEAEKVKGVDVIVVGSSHAYRGYDPRIFKKEGLTVFNLGSSSQSPLQTKYLVDKYVKNLKPKLVIVDIYPILFGVDGLESQIDLISSGLMDEDIVKMSFEINDIRLYNSLIFGAFNNAFHLKKQKKNDTKGDTYISGGYVQSYERFKPKKVRFTQKITISALQLGAFKKTLAALKSKNIKYIIVQAPFSKSNYNSYTNNDEIDRLFAGLGEYYNFNKAMNLPDSMYYDDSHLNQLGVNVYNAKLIDTLKKNGVFNVVTGSKLKDSAKAYQASYQK